jgi:hypothetical protein
VPVELSQSKLLREPQSILIACVGADGQACPHQSLLLLPLTAFSGGGRKLNDALRERGWFVAITGVQKGSAEEPEMACSMLCDPCADMVLKTPSKAPNGWFGGTTKLGSA